MIEIICYAALATLTLINFFYALPVIINTTAFSLLIIVAGCNRSTGEMIENFKKVHVEKTGSSVETISKEDAMQFPLYAGGMLCSLYAMIKYFGKEIVNPLLLGYMGLGASTGIKGLLLHTSLAKLDEKKLIKLKVEKISLDLEVSPLDLISLIIAYSAVGVYILTKNWLLNNILATLFCVHGIQFMFLGTFQTGFILLSLLFFYDIFFVFGTDVMLTVAKSIDAPIKLLFPKDWSAEPPQFSLLGLGDIVLPGVFIALCLRYDILRHCDLKKAQELYEQG
jgi:minor histocompatibility antigen H13